MEYLGKGLYKIKLPIPGTGTGTGFFKKDWKYKKFIGTKKEIKEAEKKNKAKIKELDDIENEKIYRERAKKWDFDRKKETNKFSKYKKYFNSKPINIKNFERKIKDYYIIYKSFWKWRENFKYPELNYLQRLKTLKPKPSNILIENLAKSISELRNIYLSLSDYRASIIFKLFFYYIAQCIKAEFKVKYYKSGWFRGTPVDLDISRIIDNLSKYYLNIKDIENDTKANKYSCWCGKYKKKQKKKFICEVRNCKTEISKLPREPWHEDPQSFVKDNVGPLNHYNEPQEYKRHEKELRKLLLIKNKIKILTIKHPISKQIYKVTPNEMIIDNFFRLNFHNDKNEVEKILFSNFIEITKTPKINNRVTLYKDNENVEYYWGELKNNKPHGKGFSEKYETNEANKKVFKKVGIMWWKKYSKNLNAKDLKGYIISEKYEGEWKNGKRDGKGELTIFDDPAFVSNKDWSPSICEKYKGTFYSGELHGKIKCYDSITKVWSLINYQNGKKIN